MVTVSSGWSTAGGCDVSDAAVRITVMPMPSSASISRRSRGITWSFGALRSSRKFTPPSSSNTPSITALAPTITP